MPMLKPGIETSKPAIATATTLVPRMMDPAGKRRISRSLGSLDDILVTLERLKQGPGFPRSTEDGDASDAVRGGGSEGKEEKRESGQAAARSSRSREEVSRDVDGEGGSSGNVIQNNIRGGHT